MPPSAIVQTVRAQAARHAERLAVVSSDRTLTYADLERLAATTAAHIATRTRGKVVGVLFSNTPDFVGALLGALWAGKTVAVLPSVAPAPVIKFAVAEAKLQTVLTSSELAGRLADARVTPLCVDQLPFGTAGEIPLVNREQEAAVLLYTSGTTGRPKAVALSDQNVLSNAEGCSRACDFGGDEVMLAMLPLFHAFGLTVSCVLPLIVGGQVVLIERFTPRAVLQTIERHRVTCLVAVPSQYRLIGKDSMQVDTASLRLCISGGERLADRVASDFEARFLLPLLQGYGATEAGPCISVNTPRAHRFGTVGPPLPNLRVTLRQDGREQPVGETGEIWVEGPSVMLGYYNRPEATAEKLVNCTLRTGDLGFLDADGFLHLAGRTDDLVKLAGEKIYPSEVERVLEQVEGVEEAVVVGVPDEKHGMLLRAFVQPRPGARLTEAGLQSACRERLEAMKVPRHILVIDQLPRTLTGKVDVRALAALPRP